MITKLFLYFMLTISISVGSAVASKPGEADVEYEMGKVALKGYVPSNPVIPPLYTVPAALITASEKHRQSKAYCDGGRRWYFMKRRPESIVIFGKITNAESVSSCIKIGEIPINEDDEEEEKKIIKEFNRIQREGPVVHLTSDNIEFYQKISYSVPDLTLVQGMSIGVMRKFEGQKDCKLLRRIKLHEELSVINN